MESVNPNRDRNNNSEVAVDSLESGVDDSEPETISDEETKQPLLGNVKRNSGRFRRSSLIILCLSALLGGCSLSILSPFYTKEIEDHGLSITASGTVFASVFIVQIIFTPVLGKCIQRIGSTRLFIFGVVVVGVTNVGFGFLSRIQSGRGFLAASLITRSLMAVGESGIYTAVYPLARKRCAEGAESSMMGWIEMMQGVGATIGPFVGGLLFEYGGFYLPFLVTGSVLLLTGVAAFLVLDPTVDEEEKEDTQAEGRTSYRSLLRMPSMMLACLVTLVTGISCQWYQPSLEPFLRDTFGMSPFQASLLFIVDGGMYAVMTPLVGMGLDRGLGPGPCLAVGCGIISSAFLVLSMSALQPSLLQVGIGAGLNGVGMAVNYLSTFHLMSSLGEKQPAMTTSLWISCESVGGFIGSLGGGAAFDRLGWSGSCLIVMGCQCLSLLLVSVCHLFCLGGQGLGREGRRGVLKKEEVERRGLRKEEGGRRGLRNTEGERTCLITDETKSYGTNNNLVV